MFLILFSCKNQPENNVVKLEPTQKEKLELERTIRIIKLEWYESGGLTGMDLNLFQTQLSEKKIAYWQALINYKIELLNLKIQALYDFEKKEALLPTELYLENNR